MIVVNTYTVLDAETCEDLLPGVRGQGDQEMIAARAAFEAISDQDSAEVDEAWRTMYAAECAYKQALENRPATRYETWMN